MRGDRTAVVANIARAAQAGDWHAKVETNDPQLDLAVQERLTTDYLRRRSGLAFKVNTAIARLAMGAVTRLETAQVDVIGRENLTGITGGAIVTSNHFSPVENMIVRKAVTPHRLMIVSQLTNLQMGGFLGYLMNYADTIPVSTSAHYMGRAFPTLLQQSLAAGRFILIYPEAEMWFNYTRPRPPMRGAYYYAARFGVPIVSCFVTMQSTAQPISADFNRVRFQMHILPTVQPVANATIAANAKRMMAQDYAQKQAVFEAVYGRSATGPFIAKDIAGWQHACMK
ncbi:lysophospholipid acyltransferase family protein [Lacticaseibacillus daqingensis]|uniref:lysophospholipid acyltransferase family protein n=1 Tax=Lacticaseibacillus daqingensis TaxID=2486014 RepID=UPI000F797576|nr:lysophospholipid acyltransferase family protein [Lacticaseibacillus daqingensis]